MPRPTYIYIVSFSKIGELCWKIRVDPTRTVDATLEYMYGEGSRRPVMVGGDKY